MNGTPGACAPGWGQEQGLPLREGHPSWGEAMQGEGVLSHQPAPASTHSSAFEHEMCPFHYKGAYGRSSVDIQEVVRRNGNGALSPVGMSTLGFGAFWGSLS